MGSRLQPRIAAFDSAIRDSTDRNTKPMSCHCHMAVGYHILFGQESHALNYERKKLLCYEETKVASVQKLLSLFRLACINLVDRGHCTGNEAATGAAEGQATGPVRRGASVGSDPDLITSVRLTLGEGRPS